MYIRVRKNKSGTSSVYLLLSVREGSLKNSTAKVIKSLGSTSDPDRLKQLISQAKELKAYLCNEPLSHIGPFVHSVEDISDTSVSNLGISSFYSQIFKSLFPSLLRSSKDLKTLIDLVTMRIVSSSELKSDAFSSLSKNSFKIDFNVDEIYLLMDKLNDSVIKKIKSSVIKNTTAYLGKSSSIFCYLTSVYLENNSQSDLEEFGFSQDGKHIEVNLALIVSDQGLPLGYEILQDNTFIGTFIPNLNQLNEQYGINDVTIVADSVILSQASIASEANIDALSAHKFKYILSHEMSDLNSKLTQEILDQDGYSLSDDFKYKSIQLNEKTRFISAFSNFKGFLKNLITVNEDSKIGLDQEKVNKNKQLSEYFGFMTNTSLSSEEVIKKYKGLSEIEQSFILNKYDQQVTIHCNKDSRIKAHFAICYLALSILRYVEFILKKENIQLSLEKLNEYLKEIYEVNVEINGIKSKIATKIPKEIEVIFNALKIKSPEEYIKKSRK